MSITQFTIDKIIVLIFVSILVIWPICSQCLPIGDFYYLWTLAMVSLFGILRSDATTYTKIDVVLIIAVLYNILNFHSPIDIRIIFEGIAIIAIWCYTRYSSNQKLILYGFIISAFTQSVLAILQCFKLISSNHEFFTITGSFNNPGPLAAYIVLVLPLLILFKQQTKSSVSKVVALSILTIFSIVLILTKSRAAVFSLLCSIVLYLSNTNVKSHVINKLKLFKNFILTLGILSILLLLYQLRPDSANARIRIWIVCFQMIKDAPLFGVGTNGFASSYMTAQTEYLKTASALFRISADDVIHPFNEVLLLLCEQGVVGLLIWGVFFVLVYHYLWRIFKNNKSPLFLSAVIYLLLAQFSYPSAITDIKIVFICILACGLGRVKDCRNYNISPAVFKSILSLMVVVLVLFFSLQVKAEHSLNSYYKMTSNAIDISSKQPVVYYIKHQPDLLDIYGQSLLLLEDYEMAIHVLNRQSQYINTSDVQMLLGETHEIMGDTVQAISHYKRAQQMRPGLMTPLYNQFCIYQQLDQFTAIEYAKKLLTFTPKIKNEKTIYMQKQAEAYLNNH